MLRRCSRQPSRSQRWATTMGSPFANIPTRSPPDRAGSLLPPKNTRMAFM
jgi:hypothetical protein